MSCSSVTACRLAENGAAYPIRIWLADFDRRNQDDLSRLNILNPAGLPVQVAQFAPCPLSRAVAAYIPLNADKHLAGTIAYCPSIPPAPASLRSDGMSLRSTCQLP